MRFLLCLLLLPALCGCETQISAVAESAPRPVPFQDTASPAVITQVDPTAQVLTGVVVAISDGDTLTVLDESKTQHKIRLDGVDTPEKGQAFGTRAKH